MEEDNIVILYTSAGNFIGIEKDNDGETATLNPAFVWYTDMVQGPNGVAFIRQALPLHDSLEASKLTVKYQGIQRVADWSGDYKKNIVKNVDDTIEAMSQAENAKNSNIQVAGNGGGIIV